MEKVSGPNGTDLSATAFHQSTCDAGQREDLANFLQEFLKNPEISHFAVSPPHRRYGT
jgi:hypothetical protein